MTGRTIEKLEKIIGENENMFRIKKGELDLAIQRLIAKDALKLQKTHNTEY